MNKKGVISLLLAITLIFSTFSTLSTIALAKYDPDDPTYPHYPIYTFPNNAGYDSEEYAEFYKAVMNDYQARINKCYDRIAEYCSEIGHWNTLKSETKAAYEMSKNSVNWVIARNCGSLESTLHSISGLILDLKGAAGMDPDALVGLYEFFSPLDRIKTKINAKIALKSIDGAIEDVNKLETEDNEWMEKLKESRDAFCKKYPYPTYPIEW